MIGLPVGIALSFLGSSLLEHRFGWRFTFYIAAIPGIVCRSVGLLIWEPVRGSAEVHKITAAAKRKGSPYLLVLSIPTMWWIIASGAFHNFNMYAIGAFLSPFPPAVSSLEQIERRYDLDGRVRSRRYPRTDVGGCWVIAW